MPAFIHYFEIPVADLARAVPFYERVFRIRLEPRTVDGYPMALFPAGGEGSGAGGALAQGDVYIPGKQGPILYFTVERIHEVLERVTEAGCPILYPAKVLEDGGMVAEFEDCEGNRIALYQEG